MPASRYDDWHHLRYVGDRALAAQHLPLARKVLGFVQEQAAVNGLQTYKHVQPLEGGGHVVGELIGGIPRVTIVVEGAQPPRRLDLIEGFILRPTKSLEAGDTPLDPLVLTVPKTDDDAWRSLFYSADSFGYAGTDKDFRGVYSQQFGPRVQLESQLGAGAIWSSRDGEVVSWFRGYRGYWPPHYAHPGASHSGFVTIYGYLVFQVADPNERVMAAAARDGHLFVLVASGDWEMPSPTPPGAPSICGDVWASQPFSDVFHTYRLYRYPLGIKTDPRGVRVYDAASSEGELLLEVPLQRAYAAWSFNSDVTKLVSIQLPEKAILYTPAMFVEDPAFPGDHYTVSTDEFDTYPTTGAQRFEIAITHDDGNVSATFSQAAAGSVVAEEDGVQLELVERGDYFSDTAQVNYKCGDWELIASRSLLAGAPGGGVLRNGEQCICLHAHLPTRTFVFYHYEWYINPTPRYIRGRYRVFRADEDGVIVEVPDVDPAPVDRDSPVSLGLDLALAGVPTVMGFGKTNLPKDAWDWFRPWDGITTLLCVTFNRSFVTYDDAAVGTSHDVGWLPVWRGPMVGYTFTVGEHYGAGGVFFGSRNFSPPWTWEWTEGAIDNIPKRLYFNGVRVGSLDAVTSNIFFGRVAALTCDQRISPPETLVISDASPMQLQAKVAFADNPDEEAMLDQFDEPLPLRWTTNGDVTPALAGLESALPSDRPVGRSVVIGHTGKPRREQRGGITA